MGRTVVVITGASSGIGAAFARKLAPEHDLLLIARRQERLDQLREELTAAHQGEVETLALDLSCEKDLQIAAERIADEDRLLLLINNAGFGSKGRFWEGPLEPQEKMHRLHVMATVRLTYAALRNLVARDCGGVINVASVAAFVRIPGSIAYAATKSWMNAFTEGLWVELRSVESNVKMQALCPGYTYSEFHDNMSLDRSRLADSKFWMTAEEVVEASLAGLAKGKLFVVPGWRYRLITGFLSTIPTPLRLAVATRVGRSRRQLMGTPSSNANLGGTR